jgi:hypothetical protein
MPTIAFANPLSHDNAGRRTWRQCYRNVLCWIRQAVCGLHGHDLMVHFERRRICLQCAACGHQTPGWRLAVSQPKRVYDSASPASIRITRSEDLARRRTADPSSRVKSAA